MLLKQIDYSFIMFNHEQGIYNDRTINNPSASYSKENMYKIYRIISIKRIIFTQT